MGAARENRPSENTLNHIHRLMPHLFITCWYPLREEALEYIQEARELLDTLEKQLKEEAKNV